jgi:hypothetical protein
MTPERWQQIRNVLERALEMAPEQRSGFLAQACSSDLSLRREVETLLASNPEVPSNFLDSTMLRLTLTAGTKLGDYEVKSLLGSGGMGEVYRARDSRLGRDVAIKVLPPSLSSDSDRLRRFEQEARAAAALNHPNILAVFQMGTYQGAPYLVSELLEGETLREQIKRGRMTVRKAIDYGVQLARGLAAANEKGIVHRDLKPENLFVTKDGRLTGNMFCSPKSEQPLAWPSLRLPRVAPTNATCMCPPKKQVWHTDLGYPQTANGFSFRKWILWGGNRAEYSLLTEALSAKWPVRRQRVARMRAGVQRASGRTSAPMPETDSISGAGGFLTVRRNR